MNESRDDCAAIFDIHSAETPVRLLTEALAAAKEAGMPDTAAAIEKALEQAKLELFDLGMAQFGAHHAR